MVTNSQCRSPVECRGALSFDRAGFWRTGYDNPLSLIGTMSCPLMSRFLRYCLLPTLFLALTSGIRNAEAQIAAVSDEYTSCATVTDAH